MLVIIIYREGLCTGWLNESSLSEVPSTVPLYPRLKNPFHLPSDPLVPIVLIGPGTGVSPLIGFLNHRLMLSFMEFNLFSLFVCA